MVTVQRYAKKNNLQVFCRLFFEKSYFFITLIKVVLKLKSSTFSILGISQEELFAYQTGGFSNLS